jgi:hypothetical protein
VAVFYIYAIILGKLLKGILMGFMDMVMEMEDVAESRLYLMHIELPSGMDVVKIGKSSGHSSKARMLQICGSIFDKLRCTPKIKIVRDRPIDRDVVFKYESLLHDYFSEYQYKSKVKWDGVTECFVLSVDEAIKAYELIIDGKVPTHKYYGPPEIVEDRLNF